MAVLVRDEFFLYFIFRFFFSILFLFLIFLFLILFLVFDFFLFVFVLFYFHVFNFPLWHYEPPYTCNQAEFVNKNLRKALIKRSTLLNRVWQGKLIRHMMAKLHFNIIMII